MTKAGHKSLAFFFMPLSDIIKHHRKGKKNQVRIKLDTLKSTTQIALSIILMIILKGSPQLLMQPEEVPDCFNYTITCKEDKRVYKHIYKDNGHCKKHTAGLMEEVNCKDISESTLKFRVREKEY